MSPADPLPLPQAFWKAIQGSASFRRFVMAQAPPEVARSVGVAAQFQMGPPPPELYPDTLQDRLQVEWDFLLPNLEKNLLLLRTLAGEEPNRRQEIERDIRLLELAKEVPRASFYSVMESLEKTRESSAQYQMWLLPARRGESEEIKEVEKQLVDDLAWEFGPHGLAPHGPWRGRIARLVRELPGAGMDQLGRAAFIAASLAPESQLGLALWRQDNCGPLSRDEIETFLGRPIGAIAADLAAKMDDLLVGTSYAEFEDHVVGKWVETSVEGNSYDTDGLIRPLVEGIQHRYQPLIGAMEERHRNCVESWLSADPHRQREFAEQALKWRYLLPSDLRQAFKAHLKAEPEPFAEMKRVSPAPSNERAASKELPR